MAKGNKNGKLITRFYHTQKTPKMITHYKDLSLFSFPLCVTDFDSSAFQI